MKLKELIDAAACEEALNWFRENFKEEAPTAEVLNQAFIDNEYSWVEWYFENFPNEQNSDVPSDLFGQLRDKGEKERLAYLREFFPAPKAKTKKKAKKAAKKPVKAVKAAAKKKRKSA